MLLGDEHEYKLSENKDKSIHLYLRDLVKNIPDNECLDIFFEGSFIEQTNYQIETKFEKDMDLYPNKLLAVIHAVNNLNNQNVRLNYLDLRFLPSLKRFSIQIIETEDIDDYQISKIENALLFCRVMLRLDKTSESLDKVINLVKEFKYKRRRGIIECIKYIDLQLSKCKIDFTSYLYQTYIEMNEEPISIVLLCVMDVLFNCKNIFRTGNIYKKL